MNLARLAIDLGRAAPHRDQAIAAVLVLERLDVGHQLLGQIHLRRALLQVRAVQLLDVRLLEHRGHRRDRLELGTQLIEQPRVEHARLHRRLVRVLREDVPAAEHDVVEPCERHVVLDRGRLALGALADANVTELGQRADRLAEPAADRLHARDERGRDRAHAGQQDAELAARGLDVDAFLESHGGYSELL
jgi:hypothetical protein